MIAKLQPRQAWWIALGAVMLIAALPRLSTYNYSLPFVDYVDEPNVYLIAAKWRTNLSQPVSEGYPPAYLLVNIAAQGVVEAAGHAGMASTVALLRIGTVLVHLLTILFVALTARAVAGNMAGIVAGLSWAIAPVFLQDAVFAIADPPAS